MKFTKTEITILKEIKLSRSLRVTKETAYDGKREFNAIKKLAEKGILKITNISNERGEYLTARIFGRLDGCKSFITTIIDAEVIWLPLEIK
jgi:hypothetical protein